MGRMSAVLYCIIATVFILGSTLLLNRSSLSLGNFHLVSPTNRLSSEFSHWSVINQRRLQRLQRFCQDHGIPWGRDTENNAESGPGRLLYSDRYRLVYCPIPKADNSRWRQVFYEWEHNDMAVPKSFVYKSEAANDKLTQWKKISAEQKEQKWKTYRKMLHVRHPFIRLLSAYLDKITSQQTNAYRSKTLRALDRPIPQNLNSRSHDITFSDFVESILFYENEDIHWKPYTEICQVCQTSFNYILRLETPEDRQWFYSELGAAQSPGAFNMRRDVVRHTTDQVSVYFRQLSKKQISQLYKRYLGDFAAFGYHFTSNYSCGFFD